MNVIDLLINTLEHWLERQNNKRRTGRTTKLIEKVNACERPKIIVVNDRNQLSMVLLKGDYEVMTGRDIERRLRGNNRKIFIDHFVYEKMVIAFMEEIRRLRRMEK